MEKLKYKNPFGKTGLYVPQIIYGTSYLGNLYSDLSDDVKLEIVKKWFECTEIPVVIDTAGKYGAGLALEKIGEMLEKLDVDPDDIIISNKLGWYRVPLKTKEPTFESGVWVNIKNDAVQKISYHGILDCWEQGKELLGNRYTAQLVSVHDPDEFLAAAKTSEERTDRFNDVVLAYKALFQLKEKGEVKAIGIGSKDWEVIKELYKFIKFDWVMFACKFTLYYHPKEIIEFIDNLQKNGVGIINSAVFNAGFLTGGEFFDYRKLDPNNNNDKNLFKWREKFFSICKTFNVKPAEACIKFGISHPAINSLALNTSHPDKMNRNVKTLLADIPTEFWTKMKKERLVDQDYLYL